MGSIKFGTTLGIILVWSLTGAQAEKRQSLQEILPNLCDRRAALYDRSDPTDPSFPVQAKHHRNPEVNTGLDATLLSATGYSFRDQLKNKVSFRPPLRKESPSLPPWAVETNYSYVSGRQNRVFGTMVYLPREQSSGLILYPLAPRVSSQTYSTKRTVLQFLLRGFDVITIDGRTHEDLSTDEVKEVEPPTGGFEEGRDLVEILNLLGPLKAQGCIEKISGYGTCFAARALWIAMSITDKQEWLDSSVLIEPTIVGHTDLKNFVTKSNFVQMSPALAVPLFIHRADLTMNLLGEVLFFRHFNEEIQTFANKHRDAFPYVPEEELEGIDVYRYFDIVSAPYFLRKYRSSIDRFPSKVLKKPILEKEDLERLVNLYIWPPPLSPQVTLLHSNDDLMIPVHGSRQFCEYLKQKNVRSSCYFFERGGHAGLDSAYEPTWYYDNLVRLF